MWLLILVFPIFLFILFFSETCIGVLFSPKYQEASIALIILSTGALIQSAIGPVGATLLAMGKSQIIMKVNIASVFLSIFFNLILIPVFGMAGAAVGCTIALVAQQLAMLQILKKALNLVLFNRNLFIYIIFCLLVVLVINIWCKTFIQGFPSLIGVSLLHYMISLSGVTLCFYLIPSRAEFGNPFKILKKRVKSD